MAAPKGNKYAVGNSGPPRRVCPEDDELEALGKEMVEWVKLNNPIHLCEWYSFEKDITDKCWEAMRQKEVFIHYYKKALKMIGMNYVKEDTGIESNVKNRWLRLYWKDLKDHEDQDKDDDVKRQKTIAETVAPDQLAQIQAFMSLLDSARNNAINNNKSE